MTGDEWLTTTTILDHLRDYQNQAAWHRFTERFRQPIVSFARGLGLAFTDAEDVAQETLLAFADAHRAGQYDRTKGRLSRWLFGIAYRQALSERRSGGRRAARAPEPLSSGLLSRIPDESEASSIWDREWDQAMLERCMSLARNEVEPITYQAFELVVRGARTPAQAASELNVPLKTIYNAKHRVLKRIRELRAALEDLP